MLRLQPGGKRSWRRVLGCHRVTLTVERKVSPPDDRPRMVRIEESLKSQLVAGSIDLPTFEYRFERALWREEAV